jgi:hypothetical protein
MIKRAKEYLFGKAPVLWYPDEREYIITECDKMTSAIGMELKGKPKAGSVVHVSKEKDFRTFKSTVVTDFEGGFILETPYLTAKFLEV